MIIVIVNPCVFKLSAKQVLKFRKRTQMYSCEQTLSLEQHKKHWIFVFCQDFFYFKLLTISFYFRKNVTCRVCGCCMFYIHTSKYVENYCVKLLSVIVIYLISFHV